MCSFWWTVEFTLAKELVCILRMGFLTLFAITTETIGATKKEATAMAIATTAEEVLVYDFIPNCAEELELLSLRNFKRQGRHSEWEEERLKLKARPHTLEGRMLRCSVFGLLDASSKVQDHRRWRGWWIGRSLKLDMVTLASSLECLLKPLKDNWTTALRMLSGVLRDHKKFEGAGQPERRLVGIERKNEGRCGLIGTDTVNADLL